jgi:hypothetical protein
MVARVFADSRRCRVDIGFRAFEDLHETPCRVEQHAGNVAGSILSD